MNKSKIYHDLRDKKSSSLLIELKSFTSKINQRVQLSVNNDITKISNDYQEFLYKSINTYSKIFNIEYERAKNTYSDISECFEDIITKSTYNKIITFITQNEKTSQFDMFIKKFSFLTLEHLRIASYIDLFELGKQIENFSGLIFEKSPRDKGVYISNLICYFKFKYPNENLLYLITFALLNQSIPDLKAHIIYCKLFRSKTSITPKEDYSITMIESAMEFIENLDNNHDALDITKEEYEAKCFENEKKISIYFLTNNKIFGKNENYSFSSGKLVEMLNNYFFFSKLKDSNSTERDKIKDMSTISSIPIKSLYTQYFVNFDFKDLTFNQIEQLYNDFKIILKLIESDIHK